MDEAGGGRRRRQWRCVGPEISLPLGVRRGRRRRQWRCVGPEISLPLGVRRGAICA
jgi:hypothetical protein